jgi:hypothetical protein
VRLTPGSAWLFLIAAEVIAATEGLGEPVMFSSSTVDGARCRRVGRDGFKKIKGRFVFLVLIYIPILPSRRLVHADALRRQVQGLRLML